MKRHNCPALLTVAALFACCAQSIHAQGILPNGSFEDNGGSFEYWNVTPANPDSIPPSPAIDDGSSGLFTPYDGAYYALFTAPSPVPDTIDQVLPTTPGASYEINYWVNDMYGSSDITVNWGRSTLSHLGYSFNSGSANGGWVDFDFVVPASSASTDISFASYTDTAFGLVDISVTNVTAVPEPGTLALTGFGVLAQFAFRRRRQGWRKRPRTGCFPF